MNSIPTEAKTFDLRTILEGKYTQRGKGPLVTRFIGTPLTEITSLYKDGSAWILIYDVIKDSYLELEYETFDDNLSINMWEDIERKKCKLEAEKYPEYVV